MSIEIEHSEPPPWWAEILAAGFFSAVGGVIVFVVYALHTHPVAKQLPPHVGWAVVYPGSPGEFPAIYSVQDLPLSVPLVGPTLSLVENAQRVAATCPAKGD